VELLVKPKRVNVGPKMYVGMLSGRVYWAPRVTAEPHDDGTATFRVQGDKRDVTAMFEECARELGWTPPSAVTREEVAQLMCDTMADTNPEAGDDTFGIMADAVLKLLGR
jgi:hypothetical protein